MRVIIKTKQDFRPLLWLRKEVPIRAIERTERAAEDLAQDIKRGWSGNFPPASRPGQAPAIRTGMLDASIDVEAVGMVGGSAARKITVRAYYGSIQEYGSVHMGARPFVRPAVERMKRKLKDYYVDIFKI